MSASNTANPGRTDLSLNSPNLRQLGAIDADKNRFLRSYVRSQEAHLASYALEGQHVFAGASAATAGGVSHRTLRDVELESGFGTPILKPRAGISMRGRTEQAGDISRRDDGMHNPSAAQAERKRSDSAAPATEDGGRSTSPKRHGTKLSRDLELPFPLELPHEAKEVRKKDKFRGRASLKKGSTSKSREAEADEEHRQRLAERRERRRAKKAIVDPKPKATENSSDEERNSECRDTFRKASKKKKKNKGLSVPAGLALMHGFSATNLGKKRLTLDPVVGVFNKGRASTKTRVQKNKRTKPQLQLFSEHRFLGKTEAGSRRAHAQTEHSSGGDESSVVEVPQTRKRQIHQDAQDHERTGSLSGSHASTGDTGSADHDSRVGHPPAKKRRRTARAESPLWNIELEGRLPTGSVSDSGTPVQSEKGEKVTGTVILDTRTLAAKWFSAANDNPLQARGDVPANELEPYVSSHSEATSISPSHSASQVAFHHQQQDLQVKEALTSSKYFPLPEQYAKEMVAVPASPAAAASLSGSVTQHPAQDEEAVDPVSALAMPGVPYASPILIEPGGTVMASPTALPASVRSLSPYPASDRSARPWSPGYESPLTLLLGPPSPVCSQIHVERHRLRGPDAVVGSRNLEHDPARKQSRRAHHGGSDMDSFEATQASVVTHLEGWATAGLQAGCAEPVPMFLSDLAGLEWLTYQGEGVVQAKGDPSPTRHLRVTRETCAPDFTQNQMPPIDTGGEDWIEEELYDDDSYPCERVGGAPVLPPDLALEVLDTEDGFLDPHDAGCSEDITAELETCAYVPRDLDCDPEPDTATFGWVATATDLEEDLGSESDHEQSVLESLRRFSQGRALLLGVSEVERGNGGIREGLSQAEEDVARSLKGHWQPQRY